MRIEKDKKYFGVYLACVICATLLTIAVVVLLIYFALQDDVKMWIVVLPILAIVGDLFAFNSFIGYAKTPDVILIADEEKIVFTPDKRKQIIELQISEIKSVEIKRPVICRSGKRIVLRTDNAEYFLEDIKDMDSAYEGLLSILKGRE